MEVKAPNLVACFSDAGKIAQPRRNRAEGETAHVIVNTDLRHIQVFGMRFGGKGFRMQGVDDAE